MVNVERMGERPRLVVVDDEPAALIGAEEVLGRAGFAVQGFTDSQDAFQHIASRLPDIIVLDMHAPAQGGCDLCRRLRALPGGRDVPILLVTDADDLDAINRAYDAGATDLAHRPLHWAAEARRLQHMWATARALARQRDGEREARLAKEEWERTFNSIGDVVTVLDLEYRVIRANRAAREALGKSAAEIVGKPCHELFQGQPAPCPECPVAATLRTGQPTTREMQYMFPGGSWLVSATPVLDDAGQMTHILQVGKDLTEQRQLEEEYRQAQKMEAVGTLAGGIAHEFNNLLQIILGYAELMAEDGKEGQAPDSDLQTIVQAAQRGRALARQLLTFSRKDLGKARKEETDINRIAVEVSRMLEKLLPKHAVVDLRLADQLKATMANPQQLEQLLVNLAINASQAMPDGGRITLETRNVTLDDAYCRVHPGTSPGRYVLLAVSDTGHGMTKEVMARIFEPFFTTKKMGEGTGLGLSVVYGIVQEHGGHVMCYSEPDIGTTFKVYLPAKDAAAPVHHPEPQQPLAVQGHETILVVDDEAVIRNMVRVVMSRSGYTVIQVSDGAAALKKYQQEKEKIDLVLLDLGMPGMNGWDCMRELRAMSPTLPVVVATGYAGHEIQERVLLGGGSAFLNKPYDTKELLRTIRRTLDAGKGAGHPPEDVLQGPGSPPSP